MLLFPSPQLLSLPLPSKHVGGETAELGFAHLADGKRKLCSLKVSVRGWSRESPDRGRRSGICGSRAWEGQGREACQAEGSW